MTNKRESEHNGIGIIAKPIKTQDQFLINNKLGFKVGNISDQRAVIFVACANNTPIRIPTMPERVFAPSSKRRDFTFFTTPLLFGQKATVDNLELVAFKTDDGARLVITSRTLPLTDCKVDKKIDLRRKLAALKSIAQSS